MAVSAHNSSSPAVSLPASAIRLSGAVMAHPSRLDSAMALIESAPFGFLDLVTDPEPTGPPTGLRTAIRAWSEIPVGSTHHLVLEDDALLCPGFVEHTRRVVEAAPDAAIVLHTNWSSRNGAAVRLGALAGARWVTHTDEYVATVALVLPASIGAGFPAYARRFGGTWPDDVVMARYLRSVAAPVYLAVPNLVEHDDTPSISDNDRHGLRLSACYRTPDPDTDWSPSNRLETDAVPLFKFGRAQAMVRCGSRWLTIGAERFAHRVGLDLSNCRRELAAFRWDPAPGVPDWTVWQIWQTGYALGFLAVRHGAQVDGELDPLADEALGTLAPGGLCTQLRTGELMALREPMRCLARRAVRAGSRQVPVSAPGGRRIRFAGMGTPLAKTLAGELADRGHEVWPDRGVKIDIEQNPTGRYQVRVVDGPQETVLPVGTPYGPEQTGLSPMNELVLRSLTKQPIVLDGDAGAGYRFVHVWDIARAVARLLESGVVDTVPGWEVTLRELADIVTQVVKPVPIDGTVEPGRDSATVTGPAKGEVMTLAEGVRTVAAWLAYEAG